MARLLCIGDLNLDVTVTMSGPLVSGSDNDGRVETFGGGSAANVAAWAAASGATTRFIGVVGGDAAGEFLIGELAGHGVDVRAIRRVDGRTRSVAVIIEADGDRSMVSDLDSTIALDLADIRAEWFDGVTWVHLTAYTWFNHRSRPAFVEIVDRARRQGTPFSIDPSAVALLREHGEPSELLDVIDGAAVLFPNRDEATFLTGLDEPADAADALLQHAESVAITCGRDGAVLARRDGPTVHIRAVVAPVVNALGCGDAFVGGFLAAHLGGAVPSACGAAGARTAARALQLRSAR